MTDPNWYPDPTGRFELRYYDGAQWTAHVATGGVTASDPLPTVQDPTATADPHAAGVAAGPQDPAPQPVAGQAPPQGSYPAQEGWSAPEATSGSGSRSGMLGLLAALAVVVLLVGAGVFLLLAGGDDDDGVEATAAAESDGDTDGGDDAGDEDADTTTSSTTTSSTPTSSTTTAPSTTASTTAGPAAGLPDPTDPQVEIPEYGTDAVLDGLADDCQGGDMAACDALYNDSAIGSGYEAYGDSCGGRNEPAGYCESIYASA